jgi:predicted transcriptional regulator
MKKQFLFTAVLAVLLSFLSCGSSSSFESDVRKKAEYMCKIQKLKDDTAKNEKAAKQLEDVKKEMEEFDERMEKKYKDKKDIEERAVIAKKIMTEVMDKCK